MTSTHSNENSLKPRHPHDCECCTFLGHHEEYDLYHCKQGGFGDTVVARFGENGDYSSGLNFSIPELQEAERRARELGLLPS